MNNNINNKNKVKFKKENTYILNLEGSYIYKTLVEIKLLEKEIKNKEIKEGVSKVKYEGLADRDIKDINFKSEREDKGKTFYTATIPYSLETIRIFNKYNDELFLRDNKQHTKAIINVTFDKSYKYFIREIDEKGKYIQKVDKDGELMIDDKKQPIYKKRKVKVSKKQIRRKLYENGFVVDGVKYVLYKRGAGKAKTGSDLYIKESYFKEFKNRSRLGLEFKENELIDATSIFAYESLITSGIDYTIELDAKTEILLINDIYGKSFKSKASTTVELTDSTGEKDKSYLDTFDDEIEIRNCLTDGQSLLDESVFQFHGKADKSMMLLRSDWLKSNAIHTKLQKFFRKMKDENIIKDGKIKDMVGRELDVDKIKLVITPNSLKWLKLKDHEKFNSDLKKCYEYWLENIDNTFGVVKNDKEGNYGTYNRLTYQFLNSILFNSQEIKELLKDELEYIKLLQNDISVFRQYIGSDIKTVLELESEVEDDETEEKEEIDVEEELRKADMYNDLLSINSNYRHTQEFKDWKSKQIGYYIYNLKKGKIRIKDSKYVTITSNIYEMLLATVGKYVEGESIMKSEKNEDGSVKFREVYCSYYKDGQEFCVMRNPHICAGNIAYSVNKKRDEYEEWFYLSEYMMVVNFNDNDMPDRAQGEDVDSDVNLLLIHPILIEKAKDAEKNFLTPINKVKGVSNPIKNNNKALAKLDHSLANNLIGKICNKASLINAYLNREIYRLNENVKSDENYINAKEYEEQTKKIKDLYDAVSRLSSLSQIEIDRSKKSFKINMGKELNKVDNELVDYKYFCENDEGITKELTKEKFEIINKENAEIKNNNKELAKENRKPLKTIVRKTVYPLFFKEIAQKSEYRIYEYFETTMDILHSVLKDNIKRAKPSGDKKEFKDLLVNQNNIKATCNMQQKEKIYKIVSDCCKEIKSLNTKKEKGSDKELSWKKKNKLKRDLRNHAILELKKLKINSATILNILRMTYGISIIKNEEQKWTTYKSDIFYLLYSAKRLETLACFKCEDTSEDEILVRVDSNIDNVINLFGATYKKIKRKDYRTKSKVS